MTAASFTSNALVATGRPTVGWRHLVAILGVCLPVPICAASGLALPLPATVERIAASLVPWGEVGAVAANDALQAGVGGTILGAADERTTQPIVFSPQAATVTAPPRDRQATPAIVIPRPGALDAWPESTDSPAPVAPPAAAPTSAPVAPERADDAPSAPSASSPPKAAPPATSTSSEPAPPPATTTSDPSSTSPTVEQIVDDVVAPVQPVIDEVLVPVAPVIEDKTKIVDETVEPVTGLLPGLGK